jgi:hypothetical protein
MFQALEVAFIVPSVTLLNCMGISADALTNLSVLWPHLVLPLKSRIVYEIKPPPPPTAGQKLSRSESADLYVIWRFDNIGSESRVK